MRLQSGLLRAARSVGSALASKVTVRARADCGPDAEFLPPLFNGVPDEPVETDCGQDDR